VKFARKLSVVVSLGWAKGKKEGEGLASLLPKKKEEYKGEEEKGGGGFGTNYNCLYGLRGGRQCSSSLARTSAASSIKQETEMHGIIEF